MSPPQVVQRRLGHEARAATGHDDPESDRKGADQDHRNAGEHRVLLTVFAKTRRAETREVERAIRAQRTCETEHHTTHTSFEREDG